MIAKYLRPGSPAGTGVPDEEEDDWTARWIVLDAGVQAARLRRLASAQTAAVCAAAEREAAMVLREASARADAVRAAAEREAAELRAAITRPREEPAATPPRRPATPSRRPATPSRRPAAKPGDHPRAGTKGRQVRAMRKVAAAFAVLSLAGVAGGAVEVKLHGISFFLFRNAGAGAGNSGNLDENQGPGQPDAPKAHHQR